ncbi:MAG: DOMON-like domain-containing protein [Pseudomonadota bacterium]
MSLRRFSLLPFTEAGPVSSLKIAGDISRVASRLVIHYELLDCSGDILIPAPSSKPLRKKKLWEDTCFEFFIAVRNSLRYWEYNLSPSGHWNTYSFADYRQGMQEDAVVGSLPFSVQRQSGVLSLSLEIALERILHGDQALEVGISAVIKHCDGMMSYWSLFHPGPQADFHRRDGFLIEL